MRYKPNLRPHRLARLHRWARLWLKWFVAVVDFFAAFGSISKQTRAVAHARLDAIEWHILHIVWMRAAPHIEPVVGRFYGPRQTCAGLRRIITGARLRRLLRDKDLHIRAAKLAQDLDAFIAVHLRWLRRGLTRLLAILTRPRRSRTLRERTRALSLLRRRNQSCARAPARAPFAVQVRAA